jgi:23S rRNA (pseudouridine1915-N3)-methyltransferase
VRICIIAVGKLKERGLREVLDDYIARVRRHVPCDEIEVKEGRNAEQALRSAIPPGALVVALEIDGRELDSGGFARQLERWGSTGKGIVAFLIGGADGLPKALSGEAQVRLSMSKMTFAHRVARVVLAEQIYRAITIWRNEPYHRA